MVNVILDREDRKKLKKAGYQVTEDVQRVSIVDCNENNVIAEIVETEDWVLTILDKEKTFFCEYAVEITVNDKKRPIINIMDGGGNILCMEDGEIYYMFPLEGVHTIEF